MSSRSLRDHLQDMVTAIEWIETFIAALSFDEYSKIELVKSAVERKFQILSEAAYRIGEDAAKVSELHDWEGLRGMGNVLRHAYHRVKDEEIWTAIHDDLPELKRSAQDALRSLE